MKDTVLPWGNPNTFLYFKVKLYEKKQLHCILEDNKFEDGKYLRIKNGIRFIFLPTKAINREYITQISDAVKKGLPYSITLSNTIDVEVTFF